MDEPNAYAQRRRTEALTAATEVAQTIWDEAILVAYGELADTLLAALERVQIPSPPHGKPTRIAIAQAMGLLAQEFRQEIIGCGDIIPEEFGGCWERALQTLGLILDPPAEPVPG